MKEIRIIDATQRRGSTNEGDDLAESVCDYHGEADNVAAYDEFLEFIARPFFFSMQGA